MAGIDDALRRHQHVGIDTPVFIYHLDAAARYASLTRAIFSALSSGSFQGVTSTLTLMEMVVKPLQLGREDVADEYEVLLATYPNLTLAELDRATMRRAAEIRATYRLSPPDALQVAACQVRGATAFLTNDSGLRRVQSIKVLLLDDFV